MVTENSWEDVAADPTADLGEITASMNNLQLKNFPTEVRQFQGHLGNTDTNKNIQKLNKLSQHPEHVSFQSHETFASE